MWVCSVLVCGLKLGSMVMVIRVISLLGMVDEKK